MTPVMTTATMSYILRGLTNVAIGGILLTLFNGSHVPKMYLHVSTVVAVL